MIMVDPILVTNKVGEVMQKVYSKQVVGYFWLTYAQVVTLFITTVIATVNGV